MSTGAPSLRVSIASREACQRHLILRTAWVYSPWGANFVKTMLRLAATRPNIGVVDDQRDRQTSALHLARIVLDIAGRVVTDPAGAQWGIYHAVGGGETTWCGFAREIFRNGGARRDCRWLTWLRSRLVGLSSTPARRPANSRLN